MSAQEFGQWVAIFLARPFDDFHLYELPHALVAQAAIAAAGGKVTLDQMLWSRRNQTASLDAWAASIKEP
jgi:hypothetical protein